MSYSNFLTIDIGNTNTTCSLSIDGHTTYFPLKELDQKIKTNHLSKINMRTVVSSVQRNSPDSLNDLDPLSIKDYFKLNSFFTMPVNYNETVGIDRLICAFYAYHHKMNSTIIDTGSFTTIDRVDSKGFNGGYILPGLKSLQDTYKNGELLKAFKPTIKLNNTIPQTSENAINAGFTESFLAPIKSIVSRHQSDETFITGGNGYLLEEILNTKSTPNLIHKSMQIIAKEYL